MKVLIQKSLFKYFGAKTRILRKSRQIKKIEDSNLSSKEKVKKIKTLFPKDKTVYDIVDYEYNIHTPRTRELEERFG